MGNTMKILINHDENKWETQMLINHDDNKWEIQSKYLSIMMRMNGEHNENADQS